MDPAARCPCLSGNPYGECCGPLHGGQAAPTAERLMRSRYSAFAIGLPAYLLATWRRAHRPPTLELDSDLRWQRLDVLRTERGGPFDVDGLVEYRAWWRSGGVGAQGGADRGTLHETALFAREGGRWWYVDGVIGE